MLPAKLDQLNNALENIETHAREINNVAKDYEFEVLSPMARHRREIETDREIFG